MRIRTVKFQELLRREAVAAAAVGISIAFANSGMSAPKRAAGLSAEASLEPVATRANGASYQSLASKGG
jgi:hypothetical protein